MKYIISTLVISIWFITGISNAQDITNTLAPNGVFKIKDGTTDYLTIDQLTGSLKILGPLAGNQQGSIFKGADRFLHTYQGSGTDGFNTFLGINAGNFTINGSYYAEGSYNTGVGYQSLTALTTGYNNSAFGARSLSSNTTGYNNCGFGWNSLRYNTEGNNNSAYGITSLFQNSNGSDNSAFGFSSLRSNQGSFNSAFGTSSLRYNTSGSNNSAFGLSALYSNTTGYQNTAMGCYSLYVNHTGRQNTAVGYNSLCWNFSGFQNTAIGDSALYNNTGNYNTAIGYNAGSNVTTGANLTLIGIDANPSSPTAIDQITLGNQFVNSLRCNVQTITSLSDARDKKNIQDLTFGLDFITKLKPRQFNWDKREWYEGGKSDGSKMQQTPTAGFIAQEFDELQKSENAEWLNLVLKDNPEKWEATPGNLFPVVVKAIQELAIKNEQLTIQNEEHIAQLKEENEQLKSEIEKLNIMKEKLAEIQDIKAELIDQINLLKRQSNSSEIKFTSIESEIE